MSDIADFDPRLIDDERLRNATFLGLDFVGGISFSDFTEASKSRRFEIISAHRVIESIQPRYEVVLKAK